MHQMITSTKNAIKFDSHMVVTITLPPFLHDVRTIRMDDVDQPDDAKWCMVMMWQCDIRADVAYEMLTRLVM